jgi:TolB-like protein
LKIWKEVRQRRITQIVITYLIGGWIVLGVVDQVVDREILPPVVYQVALTLYLVGMAAALIIGWYHGEKGAQEAPRSEIAMLVVVAIVGVGLSVRVVQNAMSQAELADAINPEDLRQIAVLYLDDVTAGGNIGPVADGITEGLIASLRQVRELSVASRNASRQVRGLDLAPDSVAKILEVGALIDGTVDEVGDELRVSIRLLEGTTGTPLFRDTYSWPSDRVADVGTELAAEVASALRERLGMEIRMREGQEEAPNAAAWLHVARAERFLSNAQASATAGDVEAVLEGFAAAEAELDNAVEVAPEWPEPYVLRAQVEYEQFILAGSAEELISMMQEAADWADRALEIDATNAAAVEWRGTAEYRRWLLQAEDQADLDRLFNSAKSDLERALTLEQSRASANSTLSHLYYQTGDFSDAVISAQRAYEQDAFLAAADGVLSRLFFASYDLGNFDSAKRWCEEGYDRFPDNYRFLLCQQWLMTMPDAEPDIDRAWQLYQELVPVLVERPEFFDAQSRVVVAGIIGRAGLADSAQAVFEQAQASVEIDPERELWAMEAGLRSVMGDVDGALSLLERYVLSQADAAPGNENWWWDNIRNEPRFQRLRDAG